MCRAASRDTTLACSAYRRCTRSCWSRECTPAEKRASPAGMSTSLPCTLASTKFCSISDWCCRSTIIAFKQSCVTSECGRNIGHARRARRDAAGETVAGRCPRIRLAEETAAVVRRLDRVAHALERRVTDEQQALVRRAVRADDVPRAVDALEPAAQAERQLVRALLAIDPARAPEPEMREVERVAQVPRRVRDSAATRAATSSSRSRGMLASSCSRRSARSSSPCWPPD